MIRDHLDRFWRFFKLCSPFFKDTDNCQQLFVVDLVVAFCQQVVV